MSDRVSSMQFSTTSTTLSGMRNYFDDHVNIWKRSSSQRHNRGQGTAKTRRNNNNNNNNNNSIPSNGTVDVVTNQSQLLEDFQQNNCWQHVEIMRLCYRDYLTSFQKTEQYLMHRDGPLPYCYRHYIAILAAGQHSCTYLMRQQLLEYLLRGGDKSWLSGIEQAPKKLQDLQELNRILARNPSALTRGHIERLLRGNSSWSLSELTQALVIMAHFHSMSSFVWGTGVNPKVTTCQCRGHTQVQSRHNSLVKKFEQELLAELHKDDSSETESRERLLQKLQDADETPVQYMLCSLQQSDSTDGERTARSVSDSCSLRVQDYSWQSEGYSMVNSLYMEIGVLLDEQFKTVHTRCFHVGSDDTTQTDSPKNDTSIESPLFRNAVWNYVQNLFGIGHDDYDYREISRLVGSNLVEYIETVSRRPDLVTEELWKSTNIGQSLSAKVHLNAVVREARLQAELLYILRAITQYMTLTS